MSQNKNRPLASLSRRDFLKASIALSVAGSLGELTFPRTARAAGGFATPTGPILVNCILDGGPDMRHLFPPAWNPASGSYGRLYWESRAHSHQAVGGASASQARWQNDFFHLNYGKSQFGILRKCGFLKKMWDAGQLALVQNVYGVTTRDHAHAMQAMEQGNSKANKSTLGSGWGGRLANAAGGHVVALSKTARTFTFGPAPSAPTDISRIDKSNLVHISNMRAANLYHPSLGEHMGANQYVARSLRSYYAAKAATLDPNSPFYTFIEHERELRRLGGLIDNRLANIPRPAALEALTKNGDSFSTYMALQARNLHDALACQDLLDMRVASMEYLGWDTHDNQRFEIENNAANLFGDTGIMASLQQALPPGVWSKLVFVMGGEFGRQLVDNGANGTDHGVGTTQIVFGPGVRGGIYGDMFPDGELARLNDPSPDIKGETAIEQVFGSLCEWVAPGSKTTVFPNIGSAPLETSVPIGQLVG